MTTKKTLHYNVVMFPENKWGIQKEGSSKPNKTYTFFNTYAADLTHILVNHNCEIHILKKDGSLERTIRSFEVK